MSTKLLLGLTIIFGVLALGIVTALLDRDFEDGGNGRLAEEGRFVVELGGSVILEETYRLYVHPVHGFMLISQGEVSLRGETALLSQQTSYDRDYTPLFYQMAADTSAGLQFISARADAGGLRMEVLAGEEQYSAAVPRTRDVALLDNNLIGHYAVVLRAIRLEALPRSFTAAIPQALTSLPARVDGPERVAFQSGAQRLEGQLFTLWLGDLVIEMIEYRGGLAAIVNRSQGTVGYDLNLLPGGYVPVAEPEPEASCCLEREVMFASGELTLAGTLTLPREGRPPYAAALFVHGSGPVDRDGNATGLAMDAYRQLAHALGEAGIASLRFDKRGTGASQGSARASRAELLDDLRAALAALRGQPEIDANRVILVGHSEGAYLAPVLAAEDEQVAAIVLLAGAARPLGEITRWQVETLLRLQGTPEQEIEAALAQQDQYTAFVKTSSGEWADYSFEVLQEAMPWMTQEKAAGLAALPLTLSWLREHYVDTPGDTLRAVGTPALIINGEKDLQIPATEAELLREELEAGGNADVTVVVLEDLNHLLRHHPEAPSFAYRHLDDPVDPRVVETVIEWILERLGG